MKLSGTLVRATVITCGVMQTVVAAAQVQFSVKDADAKRLETVYVAGKAGRILFVSNAQTKRFIWKQEVGGTRGYDLILSPGPQRRNAILEFRYGVRAQDFYWVDLTKQETASVKLPSEVLEKMMAGALGIQESQLNVTTFEVTQWKSETECVLVWTCLHSGTEPGRDYHCGIVIISREGQQEPMLAPGPHRLSMTLEQFRELKNENYRTLLRLK